MRIIAKKAIQLFIGDHPEASEAMLRWYFLCKEANWKQFADLKKTFSATDTVGNGLFVFDVGGNKYRIIARIIFSTQLIYIRFIGTHKEYDKVNLSDL